MAARRYVQVAIDAAGVPGARAYTYHLPPLLADVAAGEAVLVEFGRRQALAVVLDEGDAPGEGIETKPILERVRTDGPLLPRLQLALARYVAEHYLVPPALAIRAMLPPGMLERLELVATAVDSDRTTAADGDAGIAEARAGAPAVEAVAAIRAAGAAGLPVREIRTTSSREMLLRSLRSEARAGRVKLEWRIEAPTARSRRERWATLSEAGERTAHALLAGDAQPGRALGARQRGVLLELREQLAGRDGAISDGRGIAAARLAERHGPGAIKSLAERGLVQLETRVQERRPLEGRVAGGRRSLPAGAALTLEQQRAVDLIVGRSRDRRFEGILLDGVLASGKTAVYAAAIAGVLATGRDALILVPEIALAVPLLDRLRADLDLEVGLLHSALGEGERTDEWRRIRAREVRVVVGTRMAVLAPLEHIGLVVVDEEHDAAYKSDRTPRYQARDVALELGRLASAPVVLGSATPDVVSVGRVRSGELVHLRLSERASGRSAAAELVDLRLELAEGNRGLLSRRLVEALEMLDLGSGDRAILVLNRRGSASVVLCRDCGYVQICPECQRPLVFHAAGLSLRCHHCGASAPLARRCPACGSPRIRYLGGGTERVEREVSIRFPHLRVRRLDRDVVERKGEAMRVVDAFTHGELDVLVGTSLVTKGLDVPEVTLVGIVSADVALNLPDERAAERTFQFLAQAIGRAGRGERPGLAIVQTYQPEHAVIQAVVRGEAEHFYEAELEGRRRFGSPPFGSIVKLTVAVEEREAAEEEGRRLAERLRDRAREMPGRTVVLGPAPAYIARRAGRWRFNVIVRGDDPLAVVGADPGPPWSVDVDPESLL